tara:strand:+ start:631 stop:996 length:366 start_codon:yes stop_codon:yes gene_type:complete
MTENISLQLNDSPLSFEQIKRIDKLNLSILDKHHLRLLAHCLESFKAMGTEFSQTSFPAREDQLKWCRDNQKLTSDEDFIFLLLEKFADAAIELNQIAEQFALPPLDLTLDHLISYAIKNE